MNNSAIPVKRNGKKAVRVGIIILTWNTLADTVRCLDSLLEQCDHRTFDVYVLDNGSSENEKAALDRRYANASSIKTFRVEHNLGFTGGNNYLLDRIEDYEYVLLLNNDTYFEEDFLASMLEGADALPDGGIFGPVVHNPNGSVQSAGVKLWRIVAYTQLYTRALHQLPYRVDSVSGCAFLIRSTVLKTVGQLDNTYFAYYEEVDYSVRASKAGFANYCLPGAAIFHTGGQSSKQLSGFMEKQMIRNRIYFARKNLPVFSISVVGYFMTVFLLIKCLVAIKHRNVHVLSRYISTVKEGMKLRSA
jgi:GT2 family glycosyltransferase